MKEYRVFLDAKNSVLIEANIVYIDNDGVLVFATTPPPFVKEEQVIGRFNFYNILGYKQVS